MVIADRAAVLLGLTLDVIECAVDRVLHRLAGLLHRLDVVLFAGDQISQMFRYFCTCRTTRTSITSSNALDDLVELPGDQVANVLRDLVVTPVIDVAIGNIVLPGVWSRLVNGAQRPNQKSETRN